jgi:polysaccharide pyruvyl transferase WcaK-like protein
MSFRYVTHDLGISPERVALTADPAFLLRPAAEADVTALLQACGVRDGRPLVAVAPSRSIARYAGVHRTEHIEAWRRTLETLVSDFGTDVLLIPHVQERSPAHDDRPFVAELRALVADPRRLHLPGRDLSASQIKGIIGRCELVIAERMHAAIAGLSSGVCTMAVGYSVKAHGIMSDVLDDTVEADGALIGVRDFVNPELRNQALQRVWARRADVAARIREGLPDVRRAAARNFDLLASVIPGAAPGA